MKKLSWSVVLATVVGVGYLGALNDGSASAETLSVHGSSGFVNEVLEPYQARIEALAGHKLSAPQTRRT